MAESKTYEYWRDKRVKDTGSYLYAIRRVGAACAGVCPHHAQAFEKANRSALTLSLCVSFNPCGAPGQTISCAFLTVFAEARPAASIGTIGSSSPWMINVGLSNLARPARKSVSENALNPVHVRDLGFPRDRDDNREGAEPQPRGCSS